MDVLMSKVCVSSLFFPYEIMHKYTSTHTQHKYILYTSIQVYFPLTFRRLIFLHCAFLQQTLYCLLRYTKSKFTKSKYLFGFRILSLTPCPCV